MLQREGNDSQHIRHVENVSQLERYFEKIGVQKTFCVVFPWGSIPQNHVLMGDRLHV